jgi:hypothetical protein
MTLTLRLLTDADLDALQAVYDACPADFQRLIGRPAPPDQAARDFLQALGTPGRFQFGVFVGSEPDGDRLAGLLDCKLADETPGLAHAGLLLMAPPYDDPDIRGLALRMIERWLAGAYGVTRIETGIPAHDAPELAFWGAQGYTFTGEQYRRDLPGYAPRLLVLAKALDHVESV